MFLFWFIQKLGPSSARAYFILAQLTSDNILGISKLAIRDGFSKNTIHTYVTIKDRIFAQTLTNIKQLSSRI